MARRAVRWMDWTDRHCPVFHRQFALCAVYTEMVTAPAVIHGKRAQPVGFSNAVEHPASRYRLGSDPAELAEPRGSHD
ncbi:MAG: tRNA-dihydrouridine synthase [Paracoccaceae bacterium]